MTWLPCKDICALLGIHRNTLYAWVAEGKVLARGSKRQRRYSLVSGTTAAEEKSFLDLLDDGGRKMIARSSGVIEKASTRLEAMLDDPASTFTVGHLTSIIRAYSTIFERAVGVQITAAKDAPPDTDNIFDDVDGEVN